MGDEGVRYWVGSEAPLTDAALAKGLERFARDPAMRIRGADGKPVPMLVELRVDRGVQVRDVRKAWDIAVAAGFPAVRCPPLEGWLLRNAAARVEPARK